MCGIFENLTLLYRGCFVIHKIEQKMNKDLVFKIGLNLIPSIGNVLSKTLISYCGNAEEVFSASKKELLKIPGIGTSNVKAILKQKVLSKAEEEIEFLNKFKIRPLFYLDDDYPKRLRHFEDCPIMLYYRGTADLNQMRLISVVGTRKPSSYGKKMCEQLLQELLPYQPLIVSGLAYGIDVTAHRKSLNIGLETVGVLGHGMQRIYPTQHRRTALEMMENGGVLTQFLFRTEPNREHFPMRNKIIAGMCDALVVVETKKYGGSIISAKLANDYHKDVFAFPGRLTDKMSSGCNHLIKTHQAAVIESAEDLAYILNWDQQQPDKVIQKQLFVELSKEEQLITGGLREGTRKSIDLISYETQMTAGQISTILLELEFKGIVRSLPGKIYELV